MEVVAHSGATSGHEATCDVWNVPCAATRLKRQAPEGRSWSSVSPPERLGLAQAGQA